MSVSQLAAMDTVPDDQVVSKIIAKSEGGSTVYREDSCPAPYLVATTSACTSTVTSPVQSSEKLTIARVGFDGEIYQEDYKAFPSYVPATSPQMARNIDISSQDYEDILSSFLSASLASLHIGRGGSPIETPTELRTTKTMTEFLLENGSLFLAPTTSTCTSTVTSPVVQSTEKTTKTEEWIDH